MLPPWQFHTVRLVREGWFLVLLRDGLPERVILGLRVELRSVLLSTSDIRNVRYISSPENPSISHAAGTNGTDRSVVEVAQVAFG